MYTQVCISYYSSLHGDASSPLAFNSKPEYAIRKVQEKQEGLDMNCLNELLLYDVMIHMMLTSYGKI